MWTYPTEYDVIVIGAGHAGCEAAHAPAKMGLKTLLITMNLDTIGKMSCNPSIGGTAKGHLVREIDALGGLMGKIADRSAIHYRMLNASKGAAVQAPRSQADKELYRLFMKQELEKTKHLDITQATIDSLKVKGGSICGVVTKEGVFYRTKALIISSGTFMKGLMHIGQTNIQAGRAGDQATTSLSKELIHLGLILGRHKTGTPPRVHADTIDMKELERQPSDEGVKFSFDPIDQPPLPKVDCFITYTTPKTHEVIEKNIHRSAMYSGKIQGVGARYCPSIEDKVMRFRDKERHQLFLEPEGLYTKEVYLNGISSSLPFEVQKEMLASIPALKDAKIMRYAYAIEYDYAISGQVHATFETKAIEGLYLAGQINGTSGYEEAAAQGLLAGINAACKILGKEPFHLERCEAYMGVLVDDLVTKEHEEPYRMFTSRAEYRLLLRQDNADLRLREKGVDLGLINKEQHETLLAKKKCIQAEITRLEEAKRHDQGRSTTLAQILSRPECSYQSLSQSEPYDFPDHGEEINKQIEFAIKYRGYIERQETEIKKLKHAENVRLATDMDYAAISGLRFEAKEKLLKMRPATLGQAGRLSGIAPSDLSVLMIHLAKKNR